MPVRTCQQGLWWDIIMGYDYRQMRRVHMKTQVMLSMFHGTGTVRRDLGRENIWTFLHRSTFYNLADEAEMDDDFCLQYHSSASYKASLAHKLNHSFKPNCSWANADHPCFGFVPIVVTIEGVKAGEELTIHYIMDMEDAPDWYMDCWNLHGNVDQ